MTMIHSMLRSVQHSAGKYPITALWVTGNGLMGLLVGGYIDLSTALLVFLAAALFALLGATWRELKAVHVQLDGQTTALIERIDHLAHLLSSHGMTVPPTSEKEHEARVTMSKPEEGAAI